MLYEREHLNSRPNIWCLSLNQQGLGYMYSIDIVGVLLAFSLNDDL